MIFITLPCDINHKNRKLAISKNLPDMTKQNSIIVALIISSFFFNNPLTFVANCNTNNGVDDKIKVNLELVADHITGPTVLANAGDGSNRLFICEQPGTIKIIKDNKLLAEPFLDIKSRVMSINPFYDERGLLGLAFHPNYKINGRFFIYYSIPSVEGDGYNHKNILCEYRVSPSNPDKALMDETILMTINEPEMNHDGGQLCFGNDGYLYIGVGDGGGAGDRHGTIGNGQNLNVFQGKILRIDVDKEKPYAIPPDNPFIGKDAKAEIWCYGMRNPWKFSFDKQSGKIFCGDVGQDKYEEVDIIEKGKNYGWRIMEGLHCYNPSTNCNQEGLTLPISEYSHDVGNCIIGGYVYNGKKIQELKGKYIFGDWSGKLFYLSSDNIGLWLRYPLFVNTIGSENIGININSLGEDENGEIYLLTQKTTGPKSTSGAVYRITK
jgi:glucose/arabinose dehydrogenase